MRERTRAYETILRFADVGIGIACPEEIDQRNILHASLLAMERAIHDLPRRPDLLLIDGPAAPVVSIPAWPLVHGDQRSYVIGCASIVAKVLRDRLMVFYHALFPRYAFNQHKGYGTPLHAKRLTRWGPSLLHRVSFRPVRDMLVQSAPP
jgi:ribonuclease HII